MDLKRALQILQDKSFDYRKCFESTMRAFSRPDDLPLRDYVSMIRDDPEAWFDRFPAEYSCESSLAKPKTALCYLLERCDEVRADLGEELCGEAAARVHAAWRANKARIVRERAPTQGPPAAEGDAVEEDDGRREEDSSSASDAAGLRKQVAELKRRLEQAQADHERDMQQAAAKIERLENKNIMMRARSLHDRAQADALIIEGLANMI